MRMMVTLDWLIKEGGVGGEGEGGKMNMRERRVSCALSDERV